MVKLSCTKLANKHAVIKKKIVRTVRSTHTEIVESNSNKTAVQQSKVYYDFLPDDNEGITLVYIHTVN